MSGRYNPFRTSAARLLVFPRLLWRLAAAGGAVLAHHVIRAEDVDLFAARLADWRELPKTQVAVEALRFFPPSIASMIRATCPRVSLGMGGIAVPPRK